MVYMDIKRHIKAKLYNDINDKQVSILVGARQTGKTYLLKQVEEEAKRRGMRTSYFDLEQPETLSRFNRSNTEIINLLISAGQVVFLDEFHYLKNASKIFKAIYDRKKSIKIFASGSSSWEIHKHLKESLAGRKLLYRVYPCAYDEIKQVVVDGSFDYYCRYGGLAGVDPFF
jgi:predicted AAA+ superfamily ATPase